MVVYDRLGLDDWRPLSVVSSLVASATRSAGTRAQRLAYPSWMAPPHRVGRAVALFTCTALLIACGLFDFGPPDVEELEARIATCLGIPADQVELELAEDGSRESISLPAFLDEAHIVKCMEAAGVEVGPGGL